MKRIEAGSPDAILPPRMKKVRPPRGTELYSPDIPVFGLREMAIGRVRTFSEAPGESPEAYAPGTYLFYGPDGFTAHAIGTKLSALTVNGIGKACKGLTEAQIRVTALSEAKKTLELLASKLGHMEALGVTYQGGGTGRTMAEVVLGLDEDTLETSARINDRFFHHSITQLKRLGVTYVHISSKYHNRPYPIGRYSAAGT